MTATCSWTTHKVWKLGRVMEASGSGLWISKTKTPTVTYRGWPARHGETVMPQQSPRPNTHKKQAFRQCSRFETCRDCEMIGTSITAPLQRALPCI